MASTRARRRSASRSSSRLGGKRASRKRVAQAETSLATWEYEARRVAVLTDTTKAFLLVLALQERLNLVRELESLGNETLRSVSSTVRSGAVSPIEEDRARVALERVQLEAVRAAKDLESARVLLAASWGATSARYSRALGDLDRAPEPPPLDRLLAATTESPEIARWNAEVEEREARLALARAQRIPDVFASVGGRYYGEGEDLGLVAQLSVPIPLFDRNRGNILDARHRIARASAERRSAEVGVRSQLESALRSLEAAHAEVLALRDRIIPRATHVYDETRRGYATGLFRYVEVLDAQRTLFEAREDLLTTLTTYHAVATDIERLTATPLQQFDDTERQ
ncbi:MAG: TolC family protein [Myxococcota bacterium]|nr:TolC family protein [Myxococcota bacterium]